MGAVRIFEHLPSALRSRVLDAAKGAKVALPEGADERVLAASQLLTDVAGV